MASTRMDRSRLQKRTDSLDFSNGGLVSFASCCLGLKKGRRKCAMIESQPAGCLGGVKGREKRRLLVQRPSGQEGHPSVTCCALGHRPTAHYPAAGQQGHDGQCRCPCPTQNAPSGRRPNKVSLAKLATWIELREHGKKKLVAAQLAWFTI